MGTSVPSPVEAVAAVAVPAGTDAPRPSSGTPAPRPSQTVKATSANIPVPNPSVSLASDRFLRFMVNTQTHEVIAAVVDQETNKVIREIPPEEMRKASEVIRALLGQVVDKHV